MCHTDSALVSVFLHIKICPQLCLTAAGLNLQPEQSGKISRTETTASAEDRSGELNRCTASYFYPIHIYKLQIVTLKYALCINAKLTHIYITHTHKYYIFVIFQMIKLDNCKDKV